MTRSIRTFVCELPIPPRSTYVFSIINTNYHRSFATCRDHTRIHLLAGKQCCQALNSAAEANESVDARRLYEFAGCGIDGGINKDHPRAPGEVIRPLSVIAAHRAPMAAPRLPISFSSPFQPHLLFISFLSPHLLFISFSPPSPFHLLFESP